MGEQLHLNLIMIHKLGILLSKTPGRPLSKSSTHCENYVPRKTHGLPEPNVGVQGISACAGRGEWQVAGDGGAGGRGWQVAEAG